MAPIPSLTRPLCSVVVLLATCLTRLRLRVPLFPPLPLSWAKSSSGKGVALTSELLIPTYPACFGDSCLLAPIILVEWTLRVAVYEPKECWIYESCQLIRLHEASCAAFTTMTLNSQQASLRSAFRPPQRFVGTEKWFRNPKNHRMQLQTNHCQIHFGRASRWSSLYGSINKIKREVITVASASESERLETLVSLVKAADGFTKCGIYVCLLFPILQAHGIWSASYKAWFEGREDVVTFPVDLTMTKKLESVTFVLVTHLKRLSISMLRTQASGAVTIPSKSGLTNCNCEPSLICDMKLLQSIMLTSRCPFLDRLYLL